MAKRHENKRISVLPDDSPDTSEIGLVLENEPLFKKRRQRGIRPGIIIVAALIAVLLIVGGVYLYVSEQARAAEERAAIALAEEEALRRQQEEDQAKYDAIMHSGKYLPGVTVEGVSIGGMTRAEAASALQSLIDERTPKGSLTLSYDGKTYQFDLSTLVATSNLDVVLNDAGKLAQSNDMQTALSQAEDVEKNGKNYTLTTQYDFNTVTEYVKGLAAELNQSELWTPLITPLR